MTKSRRTLDRRAVLSGMGALGLSLSLRTGRADAGARPPLTRPIPASGEQLPVIGMGSWITFDVGSDQAARAERLAVLQAFFDAGGTIVDSSPMYGSSQEVIGDCLARMPGKLPLFAATKVWTPFRLLGVKQMETSRELWGVERFDLMQIHNMLDWEAHLETLLAWRAQGRVRYIGITTSHGRRHEAVARVMAERPIDFVQFTYNVVDREAEARLLPFAAERGLAVIVNRPFQGGYLLERLASQPLPDWAGEIGCANWAQFLLKFIVAHPAVTCAIPATSRVEHMRENMGAAHGALPDAAMRARMIGYIEEV